MEFVFITIISLTAVLICDYDEKKNLFEDAGLVWIENFHGFMYFHYINLASNTWNTDSSSKAVIIARAEEYSFTHIDVAVGLNKTFVMVDSVGQRIVAFSFNQYGQHTPWTLFEGTSKRVNGIAIDWVTEVVYWTDAAYDVIMATSLQYPHHAAIIVDTNIDEPHGIVVHPNKGFMFWTDTDPDNPRLMRSSLGGRDVKEIVRFVTGIATTLHIDVAEDRLYWLFEMSNGGGQRISSCDLFGNYKVDTKVAGNHRYYDMDIFNDQMVLVNQITKQLHFYSKRRSDKYNNLVLDRGNALQMSEMPYGVRVIDYHKQRTDGNPCLLSSCPGVCTKSNYTEDCFCLDSLKEGTDDMTIRMYCGESEKYFTGLLIPKRDGIYTTWNNFGEIKRELPESLRRPTRIFGEDVFVTAVTSDIRTTRIYFYDYDSKAIKSVKTLVGSTAEVVSLATGRVGGLAFDGVGKNLYWTDTIFGHIMVTDEYGDNPVVLFDDLDQPTDIALHPQRRKVYWSEYTGVLQVANLDGTVRSGVVELGRRRIKGITIDFKTHMVYVCTRISVIQIRELDDGGFGYTVMYTDHAHYFTGITVLHDYLVVSDTDYKASGLYKFQKPLNENGSVQLVGSSTFKHLNEGNFYGVFYHHISNQPDTTALCTIRRQNCDQLCLSGRRNVRCVCGLGFVSNGSRCDVEKPFNPFLFVADQRYGKLFHVHALNGRFIAVPVQGLRQPYAITYDPVGKMVYWSDLVSQTISRSDIEGRDQQVVIYDSESYFVCLEFDPGSRLLFYIARHGRFSSSLLVYNVDTGHQLILLNKTLGDTRSIALNVANGFVFLIEQGNLWRLDLNGTILERIIGDLKATAVATNGEHVYFTDRQVDTGRLFIRQSDLNGDNSTVFLVLKHSEVRDLTIDQNHYRIYWTNSTTRAISSFFNKNLVTAACFKLQLRDVYFTDRQVDTGRLFIRQSDLNGDNSTVFLALKHSEVRDLTIDQNHYRIYWTNSTTRAIFRMRLEGSRRIEQIGPARKLMKPAGLFLNTIRDSYDTKVHNPAYAPSDSPCKSAECDGLCLPYGNETICREAKINHLDMVAGLYTNSPCKSADCDGLCLPYGDETICREAKINHLDMVAGQYISGLCTIPEMANADILNNQAGRVVPHGYKVKINCYPLHHTSRESRGTMVRDGEMTCRHGQWTNIPYCKLDYDICGTVERGYKVYRESGVYFSHPDVNKVHVICIGGGGGGYDSADPGIVGEGRAGDGGTSSFGGNKLLATGGKGGTRYRGGTGGFGHVSGGKGGLSNGTCVTGGTAGQFRPGPVGRPGYSRSLFCGAGGYSSDCTVNEDSVEKYAGPLGSEPNMLNEEAGEFGGGAGSRGGGTGGGGGWSRLAVNMKPREVINVTVGEPGYPSYGYAGSGVVVVTWGDFQPDEQTDMLNECIL